MKTKVRAIIKEFYGENKAKIVLVYPGTNERKELPMFMTIERAEEVQNLFNKINIAC